MKILNAFSLNMIAAFPATIKVEEVSLDQAKGLATAGLDSAVGHADTAAVFGSVLGVQVPAARVTVSLAKGETVLVGQYRGPRLPEGTTTLPEGATIQWCLVTVS
jgi:hypothetical protein